MNVLFLITLYKFPVEKIQNCAGQLIEFFANQIREHEKNCDFSNNEMPQDFVEAYLRKQHDEPSPIFTHHQLIHVIYDLWLAGQETTRLTL
jgi:cytochrome P450